MKDKEKNSNEYLLNLFIKSEKSEYKKMLEEFKDYRIDPKWIPFTMEWYERRKESNKKIKDGK